jgi:hypothetical protein
MNPPNDDLDPKLERALSFIAEDQEPPRALEDRIVAALRRDGSIVSSRRSALRLAILGTAAALAVGFFVGRWSTLGSAGESEHFLLFLRDDVAFDDAKQERRYYSESAAWTERLERDGRLLSATRLTSPRASLLCGSAAVSFAGNDSGFSERSAPAPSSRTVLSRYGATSELSGESGEEMLGYFSIRARDEHEAISVASGSPHVRYGGKIEIWRLVGSP